MSLSSKMRPYFHKLLFQPRGPEIVSLLRIVIGLSMLAEWILVSPYADFLYGPKGFLQADLMNYVYGWTFPSSAPLLEQLHIPYSLVLTAFSLLRWTAILSFLFGWRIRLSTAVLWITQIILMRSGAHSSYGVDRYYLVLLFIFLFIPAEQVFCLSLRGKKSKPLPVSAENQLALRYIQFAILIIYVDAGLSKAAGYEWWNGDAVWRALHLPEFRQANFYWMASIPLVPKLLCWGTLVLETFYILGAWIPWVGLVWAISVVGMHLGIAAFMGLVNFGLTLASINFVLFVIPLAQERWRIRKAKRA